MPYFTYYFHLLAEKITAGEGKNENFLKLDFLMCPINVYVNFTY